MPTPARLPSCPPRSSPERRPTASTCSRSAGASSARPRVALAAPGAADDARLPRRPARRGRRRARCTAASATASAWPSAATCWSAAGGFGAVAHHTVEDVALVRAMATPASPSDFLDASDLLTRADVRDGRRGVAGVGPLAAAARRRRRGRQVRRARRRARSPRPPRSARARDPPCRPARRRAARRCALGTLVGTAGAYARRGPAYWLSPTADVVAVAALVRSSVGRPRALAGAAPQRPPRPPARSAGR